HFCDPKQTLFDQVENHIDESPDASSGSEQGAALRICQRSLRPIRLGYAEQSTVVVYRHWYGCWAVCFAREMMVVQSCASAVPPFAGCTYGRFATRYQSFWPCLAARAAAINAEPACGHDFATMSPAGIECW